MDKRGVIQGNGISLFPDALNDGERSGAGPFQESCCGDEGAAIEACFAGHEHASPLGEIVIHEVGDGLDVSDLLTTEPDWNIPHRDANHDDPWELPIRWLVFLGGENDNVESRLAQMRTRRRLAAKE